MKKCPFCKADLIKQDFPDSDFCEDCGNYIGDWK